MKVIFLLQSVFFFGYGAVSTAAIIERAEREKIVAVAEIYMSMSLKDLSEAKI